MDAFFFLTRYIPFWGIPLLLISAEFSHLFWVRDKKAASLASIIVGLCCVLSILYYYWSGSPERAVHNLIEFWYQ